MAIHSLKFPEELTLNIGCGSDISGDVRVDITLASKGANLLCNLENGIPFKGDSFKKVIAYGIIEHSTNPGFLVSEMFRVLKSNGLLELITDNAAFPLIYLPHQRHAGGYKGNNNEDRHYMVFHPSHLSVLLKKYGFSSIAITVGKYISIDGSPTGTATKTLQSIGLLMSRMGMSMSICQYFLPIITIVAKKP